MKLGTSFRLTPMHEAEMMWFIVLSALAVYATFIMCFLIIGSRSDNQEETMFTKYRVSMIYKDIAPSSSVPADLPLEKRTTFKVRVSRI